MMRDPYTGLPENSEHSIVRPPQVMSVPRPPSLDEWSDPNAVVMQVAAALAEPRRRSLAQNLVAFGELLKLAGLDVTTGRLLDAARSLALIDVAEKGDFRQVLKANLLSSIEDAQTFDTLFELFWRIAEDELRGVNRPRPFALLWSGQTISRLGDSMYQVPLADVREGVAVVLASPHLRLAHPAIDNLD